MAAVLERLVLVATMDAAQTNFFMVFLPERLCDAALNGTVIFLLQTLPKTTRLLQPRIVRPPLQCRDSPKLSGRGRVPGAAHGFVFGVRGKGGSP